MTDALPPAVPGAAAARAAWQRAEIVAIAPLTPTVCSVRLRPDRWRPFLAGQHVDLRLTADDGYTAQRSYSLASSPADEGTYELVIERLVDGEVSAYFHDAAAPGDVVELRGPFAEHFVWRPERAGAVLLAAGGSGVAPFLSMLRLRGTLAGRPPMALLYSARDWDGVIAGEELLAAEQLQSDLSVTLCLTRDTPRRPGDFGRRVDPAIVASTLARLGTPVAEAFVCGANRFVGAVSELLIAAGVAAAVIRTERYGGN